MKAAAAVPALAGVITDGIPEMRVAAVTALSQIGSPGAMEAVGRALEDEDTDIRIAAVRTLAARGHSAAVARIEACIRTPAVRDGSLAEKMAFFESYGSLAGEEGVGFLAAILKPRGLFRRTRAVRAARMRCNRSRKDRDASSDRSTATGRERRRSHSPECGEQGDSRWLSCFH